MKKVIVMIAVFALIATSAFGTPFSPTVLKISAPANVQYNFDGKTLLVPVTLTGTGASASLLLYTKDKGAAIGKVTNGYLGWHQVNKIDTCIYVSPFNQLVKGSNNFAWDGKNKDGKQVGSGDYTYYIFGFDNMTPRIQMTTAITFNPWVFRTIITNDSKGSPLANPVWYTGDGNRSTAADPVIHSQKKWVVGNEPTDATLLETCSNPGFCDVGGLAFITENNTQFYFHDTLKESGLKITQKFEWVPNGAGVSQTGWGDNGQFSYSGDWPAGWNFGPGCVNGGQGVLFVVSADISGSGMQSTMISVDINDGTELGRIDLSPWWVDVNEGAAGGGGQYTGGPTEISARNGMLFLGSHSTCVNQLIDPYAASEADIVKWTNTNGDYTGDHNFEEGSTNAWVCNDYNVAPYKYSTSAEANNFMVFSSFGVGAVSFGLYAPDGTGMGYQALSGETAAQKFGVEFIDYGSAFDGIYTTDNAGEKLNTTIFYAAHDSFKGSLSNKVGVASAPAAFAVAQNSPNPFNPTTTISFTLAKAGKTTVEVYNVAGQKIDTLANGSMSAGSHSVVWNAAKFSAGVYFYTVKSGDFSKTIKMTLLK